MLLLTGFLYISAASVSANDWNYALPQSVGFNEARFGDLLDYLFVDFAPNRAGIRTDCLVVVKERRLVFERCQNDFKPDSKHYIWSISKTITGLLLGRAEKLGLLNRKDAISKYFPDLNNEFHQQLKLEHLLFWSSGIRWQESYEYTPLFSDVVAMLYTAGFSHAADYVLGLPFAGKPGSVWRYSSGDTNVLNKVLQKVSSDKEYPWSWLFEPLGMKDVTFERDGSGAFLGSSGVFVSARDLARVGQLILQKGYWNGSQLLADDWISMMSEVSAAFLKNKLYENPHESFGGGHIWVNQLGPQKIGHLRWPDAPADTLMAMGHWGQILVVIPSQQLVVVRFGDERDTDAFSKNTFLKLLMASLGTESAQSETLK